MFFWGSSARVLGCPRVTEVGGLQQLATPPGTLLSPGITKGAPVPNRTPPCHGSGAGGTRPWPLCAPPAPRDPEPPPAPAFLTPRNRRACELPKAPPGSPEPPNPRRHLPTGGGRAGAAGPPPGLPPEAETGAGSLQRPVAAVPLLPAAILREQRGGGAAR
ncbi:hypothetical protein LUU34_01415300 [Aix galericulata]|nr:hypothetical protein LUU34_01415300 [Aix galericulata]